MRIIKNTMTKNKITAFARGKRVKNCISILINNKKKRMVIKISKIPKLNSLEENENLRTDIIKFLSKYKIGISIIIDNINFMPALMLYLSS